MLDSNRNRTVHAGWSVSRYQWLILTHTSIVVCANWKRRIKNLLLALVWRQGNAGRESDDFLARSPHTNDSAPLSPSSSCLPWSRTWSVLRYIPYWWCRSSKREPSRADHSTNLSNEIFNAKIKWYHLHQLDTMHEVVNSFFNHAVAQCYYIFI